MTGALLTSALRRELRSLTGLAPLSVPAAEVAANLFKTPLECFTTAFVNSAAFAPSIWSAIFPPYRTKQNKQMSTLSFIDQHNLSFKLFTLRIINVGTAEISKLSEISGYSSASI